MSQERGSTRNRCSWCSAHTLAAPGRARRYHAGCAQTNPARP
ncbi:MAG: hypothetical protein D6727_08615 [Gammaproteobacteria bacterium]|nr:MAG: hypothetical protein D6727_08615 [Gammaproteobacteria bacterium]